MVITDKLVNAEDVAAILGVKPSWVREKSRSGELPVRILGKYRRYSIPEVLEWAETQKGGRA
jgi:hypothetical protein